MKIIHRAGKSYGNADGLSRIPTEAKTDATKAFPVVVVQAENEFLKETSENLPNDPHFGRIFRHLQKQIKDTQDLESGPQTTYQSYRLDPDTSLLYMLDRSGPSRLCIPQMLTRKVLEYGHDSHAHGGINRTYDRLRTSVYFPKMRKVIQTYIDSCPACQLSKPFRQKPYGQLQPVERPEQPLEEVSIDFVVGLPITADGNNCLMTVTDKFSKFVRIIPSNENDPAEVWAQRYFDQIYRIWGLPCRIFSDRDPKFTSSFWKSLFSKCEVTLGMTTAYHPSADGQAERTNQTVETALRCLLVGKYEEVWDTLVPEVEYALNTSENASSTITPFEGLYCVKRREVLANVTTGDASAADFIKSREMIRADTIDAIKLAQTKMAIRYDTKHRVPSLEGQVYIKLTKTGNAGYNIPNGSNSSLSTKRIGPFKIFNRVGALAYRIEIPKNIKIHPVISVVHLEQAKLDPYQRQIPPPKALVIEGQKQYVIERIVRREKRDGADGYIIKWKGYKERTWEPEETLRQDVPELINKFEKSRPRK